MNFIFSSRRRGGGRGGDDVRLSMSMASSAPAAPLASLTAPSAFASIDSRSQLDTPSPLTFASAFASAFVSAVASASALRLSATLTSCSGTCSIFCFLSALVSWSGSGVLERFAEGTDSAAGTVGAAVREAGGAGAEVVTRGGATAGIVEEMLAPAAAVGITGAASEAGANASDDPLSSDLIVLLVVGLCEAAPGWPLGSALDRASSC